MFEIPKINNINFIILQAEEDEYQKTHDCINCNFNFSILYNCYYYYNYDKKKEIKIIKNRNKRK